ncbi:chromobox protein homolog 1-like [Bradysia coprophila]|uniref:chromobox protein homolog 1-like n=1 Tax=Bradysia coprophila TaxID=38358 RepID=UPI00187DB349|nr:chromobox protein homolog 1-like [Bradysia coprophila]XP_037031187.1 chromobox protein homolog 1-like [Bradysia coprophila]
MRDKRKRNHSKTAGCSEFKKIIGHRTRGERTYYKVQWEGQQLHTWELEKNLDADKVAEYKRKTASGEQSPPETKEKPRIGFQRGLEPKRIVGMYEVGETNALMFKIEWNGCKTRDLVTVDEAKEKCPQLVIEFYEKRISWV